jgi:hypothetical protein
MIVFLKSKFIIIKVAYLTTKLNEVSNLELLDLINKKRNQIIELGLTKGLNDLETIKCSQSLDVLLNNYFEQQSTKELTLSENPHRIPSITWINDSYGRITNFCRN